MKIYLNVLLGAFVFLIGSIGFANASKKDIEYYRSLTNQIRTSATFQVQMPDGKNLDYEYDIQIGNPIYPHPVSGDMHLGSGDKTFLRSFYDRVWLKDGSYLKIGDNQIPLTCIFIDGQDNRYAGGNTPLLPQFVLKVYIVANDFSCTGPINKGFPANGGKEETWDSYVFYMIKDPTIMLPIESKIRYHWNVFQSVLVK